MNKRKIGEQQETNVCKYLESQGMVVLERNFRSRIGEIDIIAKEHEYLVFIEVKYRSSSASGFPEEAVDFKKQSKIIQVAKFYLYRHGISEGKPIRFDVVAIIGNQMKWYKNAFGQ